MGFYYLPLLWGILNIALNPALLVFIDIIIGALIFWLLSLPLVSGTEKLIQRIEKELTKRSPVYLFFWDFINDYWLSFSSSYFDSIVENEDSGN